MQKQRLRNAGVAVRADEVGALQRVLLGKGFDRIDVREHRGMATLFYGETTHRKLEQMYRKRVGRDTDNKALCEVRLVHETNSSLIEGKNEASFFLVKPTDWRTMLVIRAFSKRAIESTPPYQLQSDQPWMVPSLEVYKILFGHSYFVMNNTTMTITDVEQYVDRMLAATTTLARAIVGIRTELRNGADAEEFFRMFDQLASYAKSKQTTDNYLLRELHSLVTHAKRTLDSAVRQLQADPTISKAMKLVASVRARDDMRAAA